MSVVENKCTALFDVCQPRLYHDNLFNLTGLLVDASSRDVTRRQDDLKAAEMSGEWDVEFRHTMTSRGIPSQEIVREAFLNIQDPARRIVEELFWFWPIDLKSGKHDLALQHLRKGDRTVAFSIWNERRNVPGREGIVATHNLAVMYHFYAIDYEFALQTSGPLSSSQESDLSDYWKKAVTYWEFLVDNDDFWALLMERVRNLDDPRLPTGFVRRIREEFPVAFDRINAQLAVTYASKGRFTDARRHVAIMKETHQGLDDVDRTINEILQPLEKRIEIIIGHALDEVQKNPETGLKQANNIFHASREPLEIVKGFFEDGHAVKTVLLDAVAGASFSCIIAYGNKTTDWEPCVTLLEKTEKLAITPDVKKRIKENISIVKDNAESKRLFDYCWFCKTNKAVAGCEFEIKMYGEVMSELERIRLNQMKARVAASKYRANHPEADNGFRVRLADPEEDPFSDITRLKGTCVWKALPAKVPCCGNCQSFAFSTLRDKAKEYTPIKELLKEGWRFGEKPSETEQRAALGLPAAPVSTSSNPGCCIILFAGITIPLAGWFLKSGLTMFF